MAPALELVTASTHVHHFSRRALTVNHTQGVTLGVLCAYVVVIALLWNLPYVRWVLWPFKVRPTFFPPLQLIHLHRYLGMVQGHLITPLTSNLHRCS
jgi:hypothetical protein